MRVSIIIVLMITALFVSSCNSDLYSIVTSSPKGTYGIRLYESSKLSGEEDSWPYKIYLDILKSGGSVIANELISVSDNSRLRFQELYPVYYWVDENILRLGVAETVPQSECDTVDVYNNTSTAITYLIVSGRKKWPGEKFLIFDLAPHSTVTLKAQPQTDQ